MLNRAWQLTQYHELLHGWGRLPPLKLHPATQHAVVRRSPMNPIGVPGWWLQCSQPSNMMTSVAVSARRHQDLVVADHMSASLPWTTPPNWVQVEQGWNADLDFIGTGSPCMDKIVGRTQCPSAREDKLRRGGQAAAHRCVQELDGLPQDSTPTHCSGN